MVKQIILREPATPFTLEKKTSKIHFGTLTPPKAVFEQFSKDLKKLSEFWLSVDELTRVQVFESKVVDGPSVSHGFGNLKFK